MNFFRSLYVSAALATSLARSALASARQLNREHGAAEVFLGLGDGDASALASSADDGCAAFLESAASYPRHYVAHRVVGPPKIDGVLDESLWNEVPWTDEFVDIADGPVPRKKTRAKVRWDDAFLYVAAKMEEDEIWANVTKRNDVIFHDNDFEVFLDPAGSTHYYKEFEVNALANTWQLCLNKPYGNGGYENSTRTFANSGWDMHSRAASHVVGTINDATTPASGWTVEIALPMTSLLENQSGATPRDGAYWRLGFSRVEWRVLRHGANYVKDPAYPSEDNWVWQPMGEINMHLPERWGILEFADRVKPTSRGPTRDPSWPARHVVAAVYDAEMAWAKANGGTFTDSLEDLRTVAPPDAFACGACDCKPSISLVRGGAGFEARVSSMGDRFAATIRDDRHLTVMKV
eukprot:TRINITY_DN69536_c0_g1_i1.p1 TRINITY_DN69536_c0_g1~~TRINITY_DN69536_c0_g1_i1.p1  ORF type:complete len:407 (+),score=83.29 TRINITY_DN69536_c0_g1_i1:69-1289(+)